MFNTAMITKGYLITKRVIFAVLLFVFFPFYALSQNGERIVILWDVTGSLLPKNDGEKDLDGSVLPTNSKGNGMWVPLKKAVIDCIKYAEEDPGNEIIIVTFNDAIRDVYSQKASAIGKQTLINFVQNYKYKTHKYTNIVDPVNKFYSLLRSDKINYMFLFTDGDNDHPGTKAQLIPTLDSWTSKTNGQKAYGFYVLVYKDADKPEIRKSVDAQNNFWIVNNPKVRINICSLPSSIKYNVREEKGPKTISIQGKYASAGGDVRLIAEDECYDVVCSNTTLNKGKLDIEIKPKAGVNIPSNHTLTLKPKLSNVDSFTFVGPQEITLSVTNLPERSLNLTIDNNNFGRASHYDSFLFSEENFKSAITDIGVDFSDQAKKENSSAVMRVYFVDKKSGEKVSPASQLLTISINGNELNGDSFKLTADMTNVTLGISGQAETNSGKYYGRIELIPQNLDNCSINGTQDIFKWKVRFSQKCNPLKLALTWLIIVLVSAFLLWMIILKPIFYPRFGTIQKTFNIPGMAPLIIKFKGARMVVLAAEHQKKQSRWDKFWKGKILYKTHPAFVAPIIFKPSKGRKVLSKVQAGTYQVLPNPMPGIGAATIIDIQKNLKINVN